MQAMTHKLTPTRCAPAAIAAVLALSSTPLAAQAAAPTIVLPDVTQAAPAPASAPAPAPATVSQPVVQAVPQAEAAPEPQAAAPAAVPARTTVARSEPAPRRAAPAPRAESAPATVAAAPVAAEPVAAEPAPLAPLAAPAPAEADLAPVAADPAPLANESSEDSSALIAGGAAVGLGLLGFLAFRRRRRPDRDPRVAVVEKPRVASRVEETAVSPAMAGAAAATPIRKEAVQPSLAAHGAVAAGSGAVALPARMPETFEARDRLLRSLVAAKPDRANPFRSPKARFKRARLIMQSLGQSFADRDPQIDLSDYPQHWPEVARRRYATAA